MTEAQQETGYLYSVVPHDPRPIFGPLDNKGQPLTAYAARALIQREID